MHPDYLSTRYVKEWVAREKDVEIVSVQHHHAHIASCLADNQEKGPVIGVALDGTGYGTDERIWGCEFLLAGMENFQRVGHLEYLPLPGGEAAIRRPYRIAMAYLQTLLGDVPDLPFLSAISPEERRIILQQVERGLNTPLTSSCGRLFDAVAALIGVRGEITYEAQAAIELEMMTVSDIYKDESQPENWLDQVYPYDIERTDKKLVIRVKPLFSAIVDDLESNVTRMAISRRFHATLAHMVQNICILIRDKRNINTVALSGGCFQNRLLLRLTVSALRDRGFKVLTHQRVPPNDGGIALGQVAVAAHRPGTV
jgi:hydrogenase maturation protein HypF